MYVCTDRKYLPNFQTQRQRTCNTAHPFMKSFPLELLVYGSCCTNLALPWSDVDLAITGLEISQGQHTTGTFSPMRGTLQRKKCLQSKYLQDFEIVPWLIPDTKFFQNLRLSLISLPLE